MLEVLLAGYTTDVGHAHQLLHARAWSQSLIHLSILPVQSTSLYTLQAYSSHDSKENNHKNKVTIIDSIIWIPA